MGVKIPQEYYCGKRGSGLAFITPDGTDAAANKRKKSVQKWCGYSDLDDEEFYFSFKNTPQQGFKLLHAVERYQTSNKTFRVEDPRGFTVEVSAWNLADICKESSVQHGNFIGAYVYGRQGPDNILLATGSPRFKEAFEYTKATKNKISLRDLKIGQKVELVAGGAQHEVVYIGRRTEISHHIWKEVGESNHPNTITRQRKIFCGRNNFRYQTDYWRDVYQDKLHKPKHMFLSQNVTSLTPNSYYHRHAQDNYAPGFFKPSSPTVSRILEQDAMTEEEVEKMVQAWAGPMLYQKEPSTYDIRNGYRTSPDKICLFTLDHNKAKKIYESRIQYLEDWIGEDIPPEDS